MTATVSNEISTYDFDSDVLTVRLRRVETTAEEVAPGIDILKDSGGDFVGFVIKAISERLVTQI